MIGATIVQIIAIIIFLSTAVFFVRNYFMKFIQSDEPYKNVLLFTFAITLLLGSIILGTVANDLKDIITILINEADSLGPASIAKLKHDKLKFERAMIIIGVIETFVLPSFCLLFMNIKKELKTTLKNPKRRRWDWDKVN